MAVSSNIAMCWSTLTIVFAAITPEAAADGVPMAAAAVRWLANHSALDGARGDAVILGATKVEHLRANLEAATGKGACGPLSAGVVAAFGEAWEAKTNVVAHADVGATCFCVGGKGGVLISGGGDGCVRRWKI